MKRAHEGSLAPEELTGSTFTITNLGMFGVDAFTPLINLSECAILGVGMIRKVPVLHEGEVVVGHVMNLSLTFDHHIVDGGPAARLLQTIVQMIEAPDSLWTHFSNTRQD